MTQIQTKWAFPVKFPVGYKPPKISSRSNDIEDNEIRYKSIENSDGYNLPIPRNDYGVKGNESFLKLIRGGRITIPRWQRDRFGRMMRYRLGKNNIVKTLHAIECADERLECWFGDSLK